jgi:hypothetical protein
MAELANEPEENFTAEYIICYLNTLLCHLLTLPYYPENDMNTPYLKTIPGLEEHLVQGLEDKLAIVAELVGTHEFIVFLYLILYIRKGMSGARGDDTKSLKGAILEWITPKGQALSPPLS